MGDPSTIAPGRDLSLPVTWKQAADDYEVPMTTLNDPDNRPLKVITIGCGMSGVMMAYKIQQQCKNVQHVIYEKNSEPGGTWFENRYPGCACDVPSHAYTFPWAPFPEWPKYLSSSKDILNYINTILDRCNLRKYVHCNHQVGGAWWDDGRGKWKVLIQKVEPKKDWSSTAPLKVLEEFYDECDLLLHAIGILNRWDLPNLPGLDKFKGRVVHTAGWPDDFGEDQWKEKDVAVLGSGATSIQVVPTMQPHVKHMDVFVRNPIWFVQISQNFGNNHIYTEEEKENFRKDLNGLVDHIRDIEDDLNGTFDHLIMGTPEQQGYQQQSAQRMREHIADDEIYQKLTPTFPVVCRRPTPGDPYMKAIQEPNVTMNFTAVTSVTEDGVVGGDGILRKCDIIVCATGYDTSWVPRFPVVGKDGTDLRQKWSTAAEAYLGLLCPEMPNWITFIGPNWPVASGSIIGSLEAVGDYAIQCIHKLQNDWVKSFCPRQDVTDEYNEHTQTWAGKTIWGQPCRTWYKDYKTGRLSAVYAGSGPHYREMLKTPRWEDMNIEYTNTRNRFAFMGIGRSLTQTAKGQAEGLMPSSYVDVSRVDRRMLESSSVA